MSEKKNSDIVEVNVPKFLIPVAVILVLGLIAYFVFSTSDDEEIEREVASERVAFDDPSIVPVSVNVDFEGGAYLGDPNEVEYAIVEFSDYKCPFCGMYSNDTFPNIKSEYIDNDNLVYIFKEVAIMSPESMTLSVLGRCVLENEGDEAYLSYRSKAYDVSFSNDEELLEAMDIDSDDVKSCFEALEYESRIENNSTISQQAGVQGVPGFVVGKLSEDGRVEGYLIPGAYPFDTFEEVLEVLMN